ncbi:hypothetical protein FPSE_06386, partial [Fusarium pseudograminearum CS3096]
KSINNTILNKNIKSFYIILLYIKVYKEVLIAANSYYLKSL